MTKAQTLVNEGKFNEAFMVLSKLEGLDDLAKPDLISYHLLKASVLNKFGRYPDAVKNAEKAYRESQELKSNFQSIDALLIMGVALAFLGDLNKALDVIKQSEVLLKEIKMEDPVDKTRREGTLAYCKGFVYFYMSEPNLSLKNLELSLKLRKKIDDKDKIARSLVMIGFYYCYLEGNLEKSMTYSKRCQMMSNDITDKTIIGYNSINLGTIYILTGELNKSMDEHKKALKIFEEFNNIQGIGSCLNNIGEIYRNQGKYDKAFKYYKRALYLTEKIGNPWIVSTQLGNLCLIALEKGDINLADKYLYRMQQLSDSSDSKRIRVMYHLTKALILKTSSRAHNRAEAEKILREIVNEDMVDFELTTEALINLSDLLLVELRITSELELIEEIQSFITQLLDISESQNSYFFLAETVLLQAKLSLLTFDTVKAQRFLTQAQKIAERFKLNQLTDKIGQEREDLRKELNLWKNLKDSGAPIADRLELARLDKQIEGMLHNRTVLTTRIKENEFEIQKEKKICLVCKGKVLKFSYICECGAIYCDNCARALINLENVCWACDIPIDSSKPSKHFEEEKEREKSEETAKKV
jgi:tetratricopeptide (TPR) repeat protein